MLTWKIAKQDNQVPLTISRGSEHYWSTFCHSAAHLNAHMPLKTSTAICIQIMILRFLLKERLHPRKSKIWRAPWDSSNLINFRTIHEEKNLDEDDSCRKKKPEPLVADDKALHRQRAETPRRLLFKLPRLLTIAFMIIEGWSADDWIPVGFNRRHI